MDSITKPAGIPLATANHALATVIWLYKLSIFRRNGKTKFSQEINYLKVVLERTDMLLAV